MLLSSASSVELIDPMISGVGRHVAGFVDIDHAMLGRNRRPNVMVYDVDKFLEFVVLVDNTYPYS